MLSRSGHSQTKKSVSYMPLPTNIKRRNSDEIDVEENLSKEENSDSYRFPDPDAGTQHNINNDKHDLSYYEADKFLRHEKGCNSKYVTISGHRRAESLGNVGQTRRNWSPPSPLLHIEQGDGPDGNVQGK